MFWRPSVADEVDEELEFHLDMVIRELTERGQTPEAARAEALRRFGDLAEVRARCRTLGEARERDDRRTEYLAELRQDAALALRQLRRAPAFTAVAVLTLVLAIGANTAIFSAVSAVLLRPLPHPAADRLTLVWQSLGDARRTLITYPDLIEYRARNRTLEDLGIARTQSVNLTGGDRPDRLVGCFVTRQHPPAAGRPGRARAAVQRRGDRRGLGPARRRALARGVDRALRQRSRHPRPDAGAQRAAARGHRGDRGGLPGSVRPTRGLAAGDVRAERRLVHPRQRVVVGPGPAPARRHRRAGAGRPRPHLQSARRRAARRDRGRRRRPSSRCATSSWARSARRFSSCSASWRSSCSSAAPTSPTCSSPGPPRAGGSSRFGPRSAPGAAGWCASS